MRFLLFFVLSFSSSFAFAHDPYEEEILKAISAEHVQTTTLMIQIKKAVLLREDSVPMADLEEKSLGGSSHNSMHVPVKLLIEEMKKRSALRSTINYRNRDNSINWSARSRYAHVPYLSMEVSRALIEQAIKYQTDEEHMFNVDSPTSGLIMGAAMDFIAYSAVRGSDTFREFVGEFIVRGTGSLVFRTMLLNYMLEDAMKDLNQFRPQVVKRHIALWLHQVASEFGHLEYERLIMDSDLSNILDQHQQFLAFTKAKGMNICDLWLDPNAK